MTVMLTLFWHSAPFVFIKGTARSPSTLRDRGVRTETFQLYKHFEKLSATLYELSNFRYFHSLTL